MQANGENRMAVEQPNIWLFIQVSAHAFMSFTSAAVHVPPHSPRLMTQRWHQVCYWAETPRRLAASLRLCVFSPLLYLKSGGGGRKAFFVLLSWLPDWFRQTRGEDLQSGAAWTSSRGRIDHGRSLCAWCVL